jgi:hypothetical protein
MAHEKLIETPSKTKNHWLAKSSTAFNIPKVWL